MAINLFRYDPKRWIPNIEASYSNNKLLKGNKSKDSIKKALEKIEKHTLTQLKFDGDLSNACR